MHIEPEIDGRSVPLLSEGNEDRTRKYVDITDTDLQESSRYFQPDASDEENEDSRYQKLSPKSECGPLAAFATLVGHNCPTPYIGKIDEAPEFHKFNQNIKTGYRINYESFGSTAYSLF